MDTPPWPLYIPKFILSHWIRPDLYIMTSLNKLALDVFNDKQNQNYKYFLKNKKNKYFV